MATISVFDSVLVYDFGFAAKGTIGINLDGLSFPASSGGTSNGIDPRVIAVYCSHYSGQVIAFGGTSPYTYSITSGSLPPGFSLNSSTGTITGRPVAEVAGLFDLTATDSLGATGTITLQIGTSDNSHIPFSFVGFDVIPQFWGGPYALTPTFGNPSSFVTTEYKNGGLVFGATIPTVVSGYSVCECAELTTISWGGVNSLGAVDLLTDVDVQIVKRGTTSQGTTSGIAVEAGLAAAGNLLLSAYDTSGTLLATRPNGPDGLGPHGRSMMVINTPGIAFFRVSTTSSDTFLVNQVTIDCISPQQQTTISPQFYKRSTAHGA